jgi:hypothetical protein
VLILTLPAIVDKTVETALTQFSCQPATGLCGKLSEQTIFEHKVTYDPVEREGKNLITDAGFRAPYCCKLLNC